MSFPPPTLADAAVPRLPMSAPTLPRDVPSSPVPPDPPPYAATTILPVTPAADTAPEAAPPPRRRRWTAVLGLAVLVVAVAAGVTLALEGFGDDSSDNPAVDPAPASEELPTAPAPATETDGSSTDDEPVDAPILAPATATPDDPPVDEAPADQVEPAIGEPASSDSDVPSGADRAEAPAVGGMIDRADDVVDATNERAPDPELVERVLED